MNQEHARRLNQQWDAKDAERDEREQRARQLFLEEHANQTFAPIEDFLTRLDKVLRAAGGSIEIDAMWEHLGDRKLRRVAYGLRPPLTVAARSGEQKPFGPDKEMMATGSNNEIG